MAIKSSQLVLLRHRKAVGGAVLDAIATENADAEVDGVVAQLLLLRGFVHHPIDHRKVDRADPNAPLTGDALVELVVNPAPITLGWDELLVGVLHRDRTALHVVKRDRKALGQIPGCIDCIPGVVTDLFEEAEHGLKGERTKRSRKGRNPK